MATDGNFDEYDMNETPAEEVLPESNDADNEQQRSWEMEKSALEQTNFNLNQELLDLKQKIKEYSSNNEQIVAELGRSGGEIVEAGKHRRILEAARNELSQKNIELESSVARLRIEKEERDNALATVNKEKQAVNVELFALKDQLKSLSDEKAALMLSMEALQQERRSMAFDREKSQSENELYAESKRWMLREISERDNIISKQRLELAAKDMELMNEKLRVEHNATRLSLQLEELEQKLEMAKTDSDKYLERLEDAKQTHLTEVANFEAEIKCQSELVAIHKENFERAQMCAAELEEKANVQLRILQEVEGVLEEARKELADQREAYENQLLEKEKTIDDMRDELLKTNEMLKSKHGVHVNITEDELTSLSPAAAETAKLLRSGQSLTGFVKEHARLAGELTEAREYNKMLETELSELCEEIKSRAPEFMTQKNMLDASFDKNSALQKQLEMAQKERQELMNQRDSASRELAFTRAELEKFQREFVRVSKIAQQTMFANEREMRAADDESWTADDDVRLFSTVGQLLQRNAQLESDIEREKAKAAQAATLTQNTELVTLKQELAASKDLESKLQAQIGQLTSSLEIVHEQSSRLQEMVKDNVDPSAYRAMRLKAEEAEANLSAAHTKVQRLENYIEILKEDRDKREKMLGEKLELSDAALSSVKSTNATLEVSFEAQKKLTREMSKELEMRQKELEKTQKEVERLLTNDAKRTSSSEEMTRKLVEIQDLASTLKVEKRVVQDELTSTKNEANRLRAEVNSLQTVVAREQQMMMSISEMTARLGRIEAERMSNGNTQLEMLRLERDSLKAVIARLNDQMTHSRNETKLTQQRQSQELSLLRTQLSEKEQQILNNDRELVDLRAKLASFQAQYTQSDTIGMTPDRLKKECQQLKNRVQFLENQLDETKNKLFEAETEKAKRMDEKEIVVHHSDVLEQNLKQTEIMGGMERERLEARAKACQEQADLLSEQLKRARQELDDTKTQLNDLQIESVKETMELRQRLDVLTMQMNDMQTQFTEAKTAANQARDELEAKREELAQANEKMSEFQGNMIDAEARANSLATQLESKAIALAAAQDACKQADEMRVAAETAVLVKEGEKADLLKNYEEQRAEYDSRITNIQLQYESVLQVSQQQSSSTTSAADTSSGAANDPDSSTTMVESLRNLLQFVREARDNAMTRSMNAEVAMRRMRAETLENENNRNELLAKIRDLEAERAANAAALVERAKLLQQVELLSSVQRDNAQLNTEKLQLSNNLAQLQQQKSETDVKLTLLSTQLNEVNVRVASLTSEVTTRRRESELLKQRLESAGRGALNAAQIELEQTRAQLHQAREEARTANSHAVAAEKEKMKAEASLASVNTKLAQTRQLAIKYREEAAKLNKTMDSGAPPPNPEDSEQIESLKKEKNELLNQIAALEKTSSEVEMTQFRMNALETRMKKLTEQNAQLIAERDTTQQKLQKLESDVQRSKASASQSEPMLQRTPVKTPVHAVQQPLAQTPLVQQRQTSSPVVTTTPPVRASFEQTASAAAAAASASSLLSSSSSTSVLTTSSPKPSPAPPTVVSSVSSMPMLVVQQQRPLFGQTKFPTTPASLRAQTLPNVAQSAVVSSPSQTMQHQQQQKQPPSDPQPIAEQRMSLFQQHLQQQQQQHQQQPPPSLSASTSTSLQPQPMRLATTAAPPPTVPVETLPSMPAESEAKKSVHAHPPPPSSFGSLVRVPAPSLFTSEAPTSSAPQDAQRNLLPNISENPSPSSNSVNFSFAPSSSPLVQPGTSLFGKSAPKPDQTKQRFQASSSSGSASEDVLLLPEESVVEANQSSQVSGSLDKTVDPGPGDSAGESRDSTMGGAGVSSSEGSRKRTATNEGLHEAKRQRESPNEAVTSSEAQPTRQLADIPELNDDVLGIEEEVSESDPNESREQPDDDPTSAMVVDLENEDDEEDGLIDDDDFDDDGGRLHIAQDVEGETDGGEDDDDSFGGDEEYEEPDDDDDDDVDNIEDLQRRAPRDEDIIQVSSDEDDVDSIDEIGEEEADDTRAHDDEVLGGEDSQPSLDDQDREAASAIEEADDEGRVSMEHPATSRSSAAAVVAPSQPDVPIHLRIPSVYDRDGDREDQCSSSNETAEATSANQQQRAPRGRGIPRIARGIYQPPRAAFRGAPKRGGPPI